MWFWAIGLNSPKGQEVRVGTCALYETRFAVKLSYKRYLDMKETLS